MAFASGGGSRLTHTRLTRWQESGPQGAKIDREFLLRIYRFTLIAHGTWDRICWDLFVNSHSFSPRKKSASLSKRTSLGPTAGRANVVGRGLAREQRNEQRQSLTITSIEYQIVFAAPPSAMRPSVPRPPAPVRSEGRSWVVERRRLNLRLFRVQTLLYPSYPGHSP